MRIDLPRLLTRIEGTDLVGDTVAALQPSAIEPGTVIHDAASGEPVLAYMPLHDAGVLRRALLQVNCRSGVQRNRNYRSRSRTFGYAPPRPVLEREGCTLTSLCTELPTVERTLEVFADQFAATLAAILPEVAAVGADTLNAVLPQWRLGTAKLWTSGVINDTAQLPYHRDGFNFPTWSAMPVVRRGTRGGYLHVPEYGLVVPCADSTVVFFEGFRWVHGVTPITQVKKGDGYRISVVYYALRGMKTCREAAEETAHARRRRTERETAQAQRLTAGDRSIPGNRDPVGADARGQGRGRFKFTDTP